MDTRQDSGENKILVALEEICKPFGIEPEVCLNIRARQNTLLKEDTEHSGFESDPTRFKAKNLGFVVILKAGAGAFSQLDQVQDLIHKNIPGIAKILVEIV